MLPSVRLTWIVSVGLLAGLAAAPAQDGRGAGQSGQQGFGRGPGRGRPGIGFTWRTWQGRRIR